MNRHLQCDHQAWVPFNRKVHGVNGHRIEFIKDGGCYSLLGKDTSEGFKQPISIDDGCEAKHIVLHEMLHAMGFIHEQNRYDRDNYIKVLFNNIEDGYASQFEKQSEAAVFETGVKYDYMSVMQYSLTSFSKNGKPTMKILKNPISAKLTQADLNILGDVPDLSKSDLLELRAYFKCGKGSGGRTTEKPEITKKPIITKAPISTTESPIVTSENPIVTSENPISTEHPTGTDGGYTGEYTEYTDGPGHSTDDSGSKSSTDNGFGTGHPTGTDGGYTGEYTEYTNSPGHSTDDSGSKSSTDNGFGTGHTKGTDGGYTGDYTEYTDGPGHSTDDSGSKSSTDNGFGTGHTKGTDRGHTGDYTEYTDSPGHSTDDWL